MFDSIKSALNVGSPEQTNESISPADVANDVRALHETLDEMKLWSTETVEWLEEEQSRLAQEGETEMAAELDDLIAYVQSIFFRIEYGDYSIQNAENEDEDTDDDGKAGDEVDEE